MKKSTTVIAAALVLAAPIFAQREAQEPDPQSSDAEGGCCRMMQGGMMDMDGAMEAMQERMREMRSLMVVVCALGVIFF